MYQVSVGIDLPAPDTGRGDPAPVFRENAGDLVDIHLAQLLLPAHPVDLDRDRKGLFGDNDSIEVRVKRLPEPVA